LTENDLEDIGLLVIDMQNGFCHPQGSLSRKGTDISNLRKIIPNIVKVVNVARERRIPIIFTRLVHYENFIDAGRILKLWPYIKELRALVRGTWDAEIIKELRPLENEIVINKHKFSAFYGTELEIILKGLRIKNIAVTGVTTNVCVETTVRDAHQRDYGVIVLSDCTASLSEEMHLASLRNIDYAFGKIATSDEFLRLLAKVQKIS